MYNTHKCLCASVCHNGCVCSLGKLFCPVCLSNALTEALALCAALGQPADCETGSNAGGGELKSDPLSSLRCHASTDSNASFSPHPREGVSTKKGFCL